MYDISYLEDCTRDKLNPSGAETGILRMIKLIPLLLIPMVLTMWNKPVKRGLVFHEER